MTRSEGPAIIVFFLISSLVLLEAHGAQDIHRTCFDSVAEPIDHCVG